MRLVRPLIAVLVLLGALALSACGSGSDSSTTVAESAGTSSGGATAQDGEPLGGDLLHFTMARLNGDEENLSAYKGKVVLVVNTASECGFTPQFEQLEALYKAKQDDGFVILGFPADDVAHQEPRSDAAIAHFCKANFGVTFPMFAKINVIGDAAAPLFQRLPEPTWNFNKYLLDRKGNFVEQWGPETAPDDSALTDAIDQQIHVKTSFDKGWTGYAPLSE